MRERLGTNGIAAITILVVLCAALTISNAIRGPSTATPVPAAGVRSTPTPLIATTKTPEGATDTAIPTAVEASSTPNPTNTPRPTRPPLPTRTLAQDLAIINDTPGNADVMRRINELLVELDAEYPEDQQEIGDLTAQSHAVLIDRGKPTGIIEIMETMRGLSDGVPGLTYKDAIIGWMLTYAP